MASVVEIHGGSLSINKSNRAFGFGSFFLEKNSRSPTRYYGKPTPLFQKKKKTLKINWNNNITSGSNTKLEVFKTRIGLA
jgi:hypothetical protein